MDLGIIRHTHQYGIGGGRLGNREQIKNVVFKSEMETIWSNCGCLWGQK